MAIDRRTSQFDRRLCRRRLAPDAAGQPLHRLDRAADTAQLRSPYSRSRSWYWQYHRRYSRASLRSALLEAGFSIGSLRYSNLIALLAWLYNARVARRVHQSDAQIQLFNGWIVPWYSRLERLLPPPIGMSLVAVAYRGR